MSESIKKSPETEATLSTQFFQELAQEAIMGIMAFCADSKRCIYINHLAREVLEIQSPAGVLPELRLEDLFMEEARGNIRPFSDEICRREGLTQDVLVRKSNDMSFIANVGVRYIQAGQNKTLLIMLQDITFQKKLQRELTLKQEEIHKAYRELLEQNRQLRELDMAKDRFIALTTHELRTPLSAIVATAEVLSLGLQESDSQRDEFIRTIHEQSLHLMELVNDVLDFAKIRAGKMEFYVERKDIRSVLQKVVGHFENMAEQAGVELRLDVPSSEQLCYFDVMRIREVINNVISNAIKYNRKDGRVDISVSSRIVESVEYTRVTVADTGPGISPDKLTSVFNEFETVGNLSRHHKGTGLGMPISKQLMDGMGGHLTLESVVGVGSRFHIDIPNSKILSEELYRERPDSWGDFAA